MSVRLELVAQLRPLPSIDEELDWFFTQAECDMGVTSNFEQALGRHGTSPPPSPEDVAESARRSRRIRSWLKAIPDSDAGVLQAAYEVRGWPAALSCELGRLTGIVVKLACALDIVHANRCLDRVIEDARAKGLVASSVPLRRDESLLRLRREAERRFACALHRYGEARKRSPGKQMRGCP